MTWLQARIVDDQWYANGRFIVRPFAGETAIAQVIAVVRRIDDHCVLGERSLVKCLDDPADDTIHPAEHAEVGAHV